MNYVARTITRTGLLAVIVCSLPSLAAPAVAVSLPLEGFYRPGHYVPVRVKAELAAGAYLELAADAGVPTRVQVGSDGRAAGVAPLLPMERPRGAFWQVVSGGKVTASGTVEGAFRQLDGEQRLVGYAGAVDLTFARELLGAQAVVPIRLDPADPVPGPAAAWETLDALVLDAGAAMPGEEKLGGLLAGGVAVAVRSAQKPGSSWPWVQRGGYWVLAAEMVGPATAADYPFALSAVQGWQADWPRPFRVRIFLFAVIFCVLAMATTLLNVRRSRLFLLLSSLAIIVLATSTCLALWHWFGARSPVLERTGAVVIAPKGGGVVQRDTWRFYASARETRASAPWHGLTVPFFEERAQRRASQIVLVCDAGGEPLSFDFRLVASLKVALRSRSVERGSAPVGVKGGGAENPMAFQLGRAYLNRPLAIRGELAPAPLDPPGANTEVWSTLVVE